MRQSNGNPTIRILVLGAPGVGKSCIVSRFTTDTYPPPPYDPTSTLASRRYYTLGGSGHVSPPTKTDSRVGPADLPTPELSPVSPALSHGSGQYDLVRPSAKSRAAGEQDEALRAAAAAVLGRQNYSVRGPSLQPRATRQQGSINNNINNLRVNTVAVLNAADPTPPQSPIESRYGHDHALLQHRQLPPAPTSIPAPLSQPSAPISPLPPNTYLIEILNYPALQFPKVRNHVYNKGEYDAVLLVYDVTRRATFDAVPALHAEIPLRARNSRHSFLADADLHSGGHRGRRGGRIGEGETVVALVGNKCDDYYASFEDRAPGDRKSTASSGHEDAESSGGDSSLERERERRRRGTSRHVSSASGSSLRSGTFSIASGTGRGTMTEEDEIDEQHIHPLLRGRAGNRTGSPSGESSARALERLSWASPSTAAPDPRFLLPLPHSPGQNGQNGSQQSSYYNSTHPRGLHGSSSRDALLDDDARGVRRARAASAAASLPKRHSMATMRSSSSDRKALPELPRRLVVGSSDDEEKQQGEHATATTTPTAPHRLHPRSSPRHQQQRARLGADETRTSPVKGSSSSLDLSSNEADDEDVKKANDRQHISRATQHQRQPSEQSSTESLREQRRQASGSATEARRDRRRRRRQVTREEGEELARGLRLAVPFFETSARTGEGIEAVFEAVIREVLKEMGYVPPVPPPAVPETTTTVPAPTVDSIAAAPSPSPQTKDIVPPPDPCSASVPEPASSRPAPTVAGKTVAATQTSKPMQTRQQPRATDAIATQQTNVIASAAAAAEAAFFRMPRPSVNNSAATRQRPRTADSARPGLSATGATLTTTRSNGSTVTPAPASPTSPRGYGYASGYGFVPVVVGGVVGGAGTSGLWSMPIGSFSMPDSRPAGSATAGKKKGDGEAPEEPEEEGGEKKNSRATGTRRTASLGRRHDRKAGEHHHAVLRKHPSKDVLAQLRALQEEQERRYLSLHERARRERVAEEVGDGQQQDQKNSSNRNSSTTLTNTTTDDFPSITNTTSAIAGKPGTRASIAVVESDSYRGHEDHEADEADDELGETIAAATSMPTGVPRGAARRGSMMFSLKRVFGSRKADVAV